MESQILLKFQGLGMIGICSSNTSSLEAQKNQERSFFPKTEPHEWIYL